ncbi:MULTISPECIES: nucleoside deaminase [Cryobacterium]|uniref:nucleoside deaminase n=1 Tax=Cryobacterium TaxID=69578 RepID=UPI000B4D4AB0|nr:MULTISPECIES: nucleoside deaminase [Cryobacterium]ASD20841.1 CMP deaminase [Cryobacterium sp. LW097]POH69582.1 nucleoside deaminase [Cryobacterium zongtaii]TFC44276.1 nucleoside deaminase [Cryobacterium sp. TMN-39-2]TFC52505.1 nucleoside deaminase [Cryobacterium sp. TMB3-1-2]TFC61323.1 nucleoside deaminase [Cryobacterium sp. TMB1-7]
METTFTLALPSWLTELMPGLPQTLPTLDERMALVNSLAARNYREGNGGPFAAIVVDAGTGELVSVGVNVVLSTGVAGAHAEVMALGLAQRATGSWDLGADPARPLELVVNWRPCVMCYGATMWSGVRRLVVAGSGAELETLTGFDEGPMREDWAEQFEARGITVVQDIGRDEALRVFREYGAADVLVYNARGGVD